MTRYHRTTRERADGSFEQVDIPFTPEEEAARDAQEAAALIPTQADYVVAVQSHLDAVSRTKGYDNIVSACSYAGAANPFQAEGEAAIAWRGAVWAYCYQQLAAVQVGQRQAPTLAGLVAELPVMSWPS